MKNKLSLLFITLILVIVPCRKNIDNEYFTNTLKNNSTLVIGHHGAGSVKFNNLRYYDNSFSAIKVGLEYLDGIEVDLQMSKDSTIWVYHNHDILNNDSVLVSIASLSDYEISIVNKKFYSNDMITLDSMLSFLENYNEERTIIFDLKFLYNPSWNEGINNIAVSLLNNKFDSFTNFSNIKFVLGSVDLQLLSCFDNNSNDIGKYYKTYYDDTLFSELDLIKEDYVDGVSVDMNNRTLSIEFINEVKKDLKEIMVYAPRTIDEINYCFSLNPKYIIIGGLQTYIYMYK